MSFLIIFFGIYLSVGAALCSIFWTRWNLGEDMNDALSLVLIWPIIAIVVVLIGIPYWIYQRVKKKIKEKCA